MLKLSNGATVHAAYIVPGGDGMKPNGVVLADNGNSWVTWLIHWDGLVEASEFGGEEHEIWEAESGMYFDKDFVREATAPMNKAHRSFGARVKRLMSSTMAEGFINETLEGY